MSFDWSEYLKVAQELVEQAKHSSPQHQEAQIRAAVSRAYYAAFGMARNHLRYKDKEPYSPVNKNGERINVHRYVREKFQESNDPVRQEIGDNLERMCEQRNAADYDGQNAIFNKPIFAAQVVLKWAKEVLSALKRI
jgi:uncharacterized protein (UPF0332 family)